jgi:peptide/nickel transport system permease protein
MVGLTNRDYPVIQGSVLFLSALSCVILLLVDIAFAFIDPRIRSQYIRVKQKKPIKGELSGGEA